MTTNNSTVPPPGVTNGENSNMMITFISETAADSDPHGCISCRQLQEQLLAYKKEQSFYSDLKKKIALTDALIRKYTTKCQEFDLQQRKVDELTRKLASSKRDCKVLEEQLAKTLKEIIPWKREKTKFLEEYENNKRKLTAAQDALFANQAGINQYRIQIDELEKTLNAQKKEATEAKIRVKNLQHVLDRRKSINFEEHRTELTQVKKEKKNIVTSFEKAKVTIMKLRSLLIENNIRVFRVPPQFLPKKTSDDAVDEEEEMTDNSDDSMESVDDPDEPDHTQEKSTVSKPQEKEPPYIRRIQNILDRKQTENKSQASTSTKQTSISNQKVKVKSKSNSEEEEEEEDDNVSGSEMISHVADEIDAQLNLAGSDEDIQDHLGTKKDDTLGKTPVRQTYRVRVGRTPQRSRKPATASERPSLKNVKAITKQTDKKIEAKVENKGELLKQVENKASQKQQMDRNVETAKQSERLTSTDDDSSSSSDDDDDDNVESSIAFRTRTRTQSQSGYSSTERSPNSKSKVSKTNKSTVAQKSTKLIARQIVSPKVGKRSQSGNFSPKKNQLVKKVETSTESDSSDDDGENTRMSPPRTRSKSQSGSSDSEKKPPNRSKVPLKSRVKISAPLSETSDEETAQVIKDKKYVNSKSGKVSTINSNMSEEAKIKASTMLSDTSDEEVFTGIQHKQLESGGNEKASPSKKSLFQKDIKPSTTLSDLSDEENRSSRKNPVLVKSSGKEKHTPSNMSDDRWNPGEAGVTGDGSKRSTGKVKTKKKHQSDKSDEDEVINITKDKKSLSNDRLPRQRRNTDTEFEMARYPRRSRRLPRPFNSITIEDGNLGTRAFLSDGDQPLGAKHGRIYDADQLFQKYVKKAKQLKDSSDESEDEQTQHPENSTSKEPQSISGDEKTKSTSDTKLTPDRETETETQTTKTVTTKAADVTHNDDDSSNKRTTLSPSTSKSSENQTSSKRSNQSIHLEIPSSPKGKHPIRAENLVLSPDDSAFRKKFLKPISPVRSSPRRKPGICNSGNDTSRRGSDINPFFPVVAITRSSVQNLTASFMSVEGSSSESHNQESLANNAGGSGLQTRCASKVKTNVEIAEDNDTEMQPKNGSSLESSNQDPPAEDAGASDIQSGSAGMTKFDSKSVKIETKSQCKSLVLDVENINKNANELLESEDSNVPKIITRSRSKVRHKNDGKQRESIQDENTNVEAETDAQASQASAKASDLVQFAAPFPTRILNNRRRTRSSTSSSSDVANRPDFVEQQRPVESTESMSESSSMEVPRRRTRSMSARRQQDSKPVRITRSMSEPRKADLKNMRRRELNSGKSDLKEIKKTGDSEKSAAEMKGNELEREKEVKNKKPDEKSNLTKAPDEEVERMPKKILVLAKRVTRLQALNQNARVSMVDARQSLTSASGSRPRQECKNSQKDMKTKRTRSKSKDEESDSEQEDEKHLKKHRGVLFETSKAANTSNHKEGEQVEAANTAHAPARTDTPSPGSVASNPPILEPFQNYASPQELVPSLPQLFEEQDPHRHRSPVSPLPEPFQNFDGERSLSPLPISPSETPPILERPISALSLPDLPPLPPLVTPLPPSPHRSLLTRNSSRLANPVRMVSPLTTPPPRAISPLPHPPMPDAISPLKDDDSMDSVQQRLNLIPSPRNFHAVAPRHAVAVPPHPTGHMFQAARCLTGNFTQEGDKDVAGPSGVCTLDREDNSNDGEILPSMNEEEDAGGRSGNSLPGGLASNEEKAGTSSDISSVNKRDGEEPSSKDNETSRNVNTTSVKANSMKQTTTHSHENSQESIAEETQSHVAKSDLNTNSVDENITDGEEGLNAFKVNDSQKISKNEQNTQLKKGGSKPPDEAGDDGEDSNNKKSDPMVQCQDETDVLQDTSNDPEKACESTDIEKAFDQKGQKLEGKGTKKKGQKKGSNVMAREGDESTNKLPQMPVKNGEDVNKESVELQKESDGVSKQGKKSRSSARKKTKDQGQNNSESAKVDDFAKDTGEKEPLITRPGKRKSNVKNDEANDLPPRRLTRSMRHSGNRSTEKRPAKDNESRKCAAEDESVIKEEKTPESAMEGEKRDENKEENINSGCTSKKSRKVICKSKEIMKEKRAAEDDTQAPKGAEPKKGNWKLLKTASIIRGKHSINTESNQELLEVLEQKGVVTSDKADDVRVQASKGSCQSPAVDGVESKVVSGSSPTNVKHKVASKPCSSQLATSRRTIIVIPAAEIKVSGFKRSRSMQRRTSEQSKAKAEKALAAPAAEIKSSEESAGAVKNVESCTSPTEVSPIASPMSVTSMSSPPEVHSERTDTAQVAAGSKSAISPPKVPQHKNDSANSKGQFASGLKVTTTPAVTNISSPDGGINTKEGQETKDSPETPLPVLSDAVKDSASTVSPSSSQVTSGQTSTAKVYKSLPTNNMVALKNSVVEHDAIHESNHDISQKETGGKEAVQAGVEHTCKEVSEISKQPEQSCSLTLQNNITSSSVVERSTHITTVSISNETVTQAPVFHSGQKAGPFQSDANSTKMVQGQSMSVPLVQGTVQGTATAQKPSSKIANLWGNIAKDDKKTEKAMIKEASAVYKTLKEGKAQQMASRPGSIAITKHQEQEKQGVRSVASAWGDLASSSNNQVEKTRRRKKPMPDHKIAAKQMKVKEPDTPGTYAATAAKPQTPRLMNNATNNAHIEETLRRIASYEMATNANSLAHRIVTNIQFNAINLLPVVYARCVAGNTSTEPVCIPVEEKIITAVVDWTKKNNCTTLVDCLLSYLRQAMEKTTKRAILPEKMFAIHSTFCRLYTILCFHTANIQCARVFAFDLLRNAYPCSERLLLAVASSWPSVLYKSESTQASPVGSVIEAVVMQRLSKMREEEMTQKSFTSLCGWKPHQPDTITNITQQLVAMIQDANYTQIIGENDSYPTLSQMTFELSKAMEMLAFSMGWEWTNNIMIRAHLWPVLRKWTLSLRAENSGIGDGSACLVMKIIANVGVLGLATNKQSVSEVMKMLLAVLQQPSDIIPWCVQLYTADAILQLSSARPTISHPVLDKWCVEASQSVPSSLTERICVLGAWVSNTNNRQLKSDK